MPTLVDITGKDEMTMEDEIRAIWREFKAVNADLGELRLAVAGLKVELANAQATIQTIRNTADLRAPIRQPQAVAP